MHQSGRPRRGLLLLPAALALASGAASAAPGHGGRAAVSTAPAGTMSFAIAHPAESSTGAHTAVEPSIGADWKTGAVMYQSLVRTYRVTFDDRTRPAASTWTDVSALLTSKQTSDPILFTDPVTGRTFVSQLAGTCSLSEFTDNDGASWVPDLGCGLPSGNDHQSVGGGPFAILPANPVYPHAVYYCSQAGAAAFCAFSLDGGVTFGAGIPIYSQNQCGGLHGHVRVGPDGTAIVPNQNCGPAITMGTGPFPNQAAVVSTNDGTTWAVHVIPDSKESLRSDPSTMADAGNRWYYGYESAVKHGSEQVGGRAMVSMSTDDGTTWSPSVDVGAPLGVRNVTFPEIVAGDSGRAAYAFLGSPTAGDPENQTFQGFWYLYIALTQDGGSTWTVQNVTPGDPVQRGCIFLAGTGDCPNPAKRNLFDFMDITVDAHGRVLAGYADGCTKTCDSRQGAPCTDAACDTGPTASTDMLASIARESCGPSLFRAGDTALACGTTPTGGATPSATPTATPVGPIAAGPGGTPNTSAVPVAGGVVTGAVLALLAVRRRRTMSRRRRPAA